VSKTSLPPFRVETCATQKRESGIMVLNVLRYFLCR
jgi:hypothetical protein